MFKAFLSLILVSTLFVGAIAAAPLSVEAQTVAQEQACLGTGGEWVPSSDGSTGECRRDGETNNVADIVKTIANILLFLIGAVAVLMLIIGGFRYVVSAGDSSAIEGAKNTILYAIIGIVVAFLAYAAVSFVVNRLENPGATNNSLSPPAGQTGSEEEEGVGGDLTRPTPPRPSRSR